MISVIIPVYNTASYLRESIESVLSQSYKDVEIVLVDDGSIDNSGEICDKYEKKYNNVVVIHKQNGGVTSARKVGVTASRGDYVLFLDSDDMLYETCLSQMMSHMTSTADIVVSEVNRNEVMDSHNYLFNILNGNIPAGINGKLYRKEIFDDNSLLLPREINIGEDLIMNVKLGLNCKRNIISINSALYYYRYNPNSAIHKRIYSWEYESRFIEEINKALGTHKNENMDALMWSYFLTIEKLILNKINIDWDNKYIVEFLGWAQGQKLSLNHRVILQVRNTILAKYILAILRRVKKIH